MSDQQVLKLHDSAISQIVRLIQLGILTGTDVSDQLRTLECVIEEGHSSHCGAARWYEKLGRGGPGGLPASNGT